MQTYPASEQEIQLAASAFTKYRHYQDECGCCLDAEVDAAVSVSGWLKNHTGKLSGYLQAMKPGYVKFVALNPLGQPIFILLTNGEIFKSLNVSEGKTYMGSVDSETFKKFAPSGFEPEFSFYWLTGRLPPGDINILKVRRDKEQDGYWLQIRHERSSLESMVLFDPEEFVVLQHIVMSERGKHLVNFVYEDYQPGNKEAIQLAESDQGMIGTTEIDETFCKIPTKMSVFSQSGADKKMAVKFFSIIPDAELSSDNFELEIPDNIELLLVN